MSFGHQSDVHRHLSAKRPLFSHRAAEDDAHTKIVEQAQNEGLHLVAPPTKREEPMSTHSTS
jgi:hypothetical protein